MEFIEIPESERPPKGHGPGRPKSAATLALEAGKTIFVPGARQVPWPGGNYPKARLHRRVAERDGVRGIIAWLDPE